LCRTREVDPEDPLAGHVSLNLTVQEGAVTWVGNHNTILPREEALDKVIIGGA